MLPPRHLLAAFFLAVALAGGAWFLVNGLNAPQAAPQSATVFPERRPLPEFRLRDHEDQPFTRDSLRGQTTLLFFGFTHCPDICPATLNQLALTRRQLAVTGGADGQALPEIVLISVDPARDTPETLEHYVEYFGSGITGVTGSLDELRSLSDALGIHFERVPPGPGGDADEYSVSHSAAVLVVDPEARLQAIFSAPHSIESFVQDLPLLMAWR